MKKFGKSQLKGLLFLAPSLAGVSLFVFLPFLDVIRRSFGEAVTGTFVGIRRFSWQPGIPCVLWESVFRCFWFCPWRRHCFCPEKSGTGRR